MEGAEGGVNAPPENLSEQGGQRLPCRELTKEERRLINYISV
jgi:hypothetical protein